MRASNLISWCVVAAIVGGAAGAARAQSDDAGASSVSSSFASSSRSAGSPTGASIVTGASPDAQGLLSLPPPAADAAALSLEQVLALVDNSPDLRIAAERVVQQEAALRRAWALLLPTLTLGGSYTLTCLGGLDALAVDCSDRTTRFADPDRLAQQALLFDSLASLVGLAAQAEGDPDKAAQLQQQQRDLADAAVDIRNTDATPVVVSPASQLNGSLTVAVPLFNGRALPLLWNAETGVDVARLALAQARFTLRYQATRAFYAAYTATRLVDVARAQRDAMTRHREATAARVAAHTQAPLSLKRAELDELRARQALRNAEQAADAAVAAVGVLVGRSEGLVLAPPPADAATVHAASAAAASVDEEALLERARARRIELRLQRAAKLVAERSVVDAWMSFAPSVNLVASARASSFTTGFVSDPVTGTLAVQASVPLYDGGARYASLHEAESRVREEGERLAQLQTRVDAQVRGNVKNLALRTEAVALASASVDVARDAHAQAEALFAAGVGTSLDVSDTTVALYASEVEALRAGLDLAIARVGLAWALGPSEHDEDDAHDEQRR